MSESKNAGEDGQKLLEPGEMFGDYTVEKLLGEGGMGAVYLVRAPGGERYAVKLMSPDMVKKGSDYRKRFAREAEFAMKIRHENLISVYDVGEDPETGYCYIIMDYVPGGSVADRLEKNGPLPMAEAVSIAAQVALALEVAHRHGVIHRDIKPDNIMFDADGTPKLADLGVAKFTDEAHKTTVTTTGMIIGTPAYMAPEQMMDSHHIDARADIYALGVVLYEMLTGRRPNAESTAVELLAKAIKGEPLPDVRTMRPEVSAAIAHVLSLMCAPKPENRPATALAAAQLLRKAASGKLILVRKKPRSSAAESAALKAKRRRQLRGIAVGVGMVAFLLIGISGWIKALNNRQEPVRAVAVSSVTNMLERIVVTTNVLERVVAGPSAVQQRKATLAHRWSFNGKTEDENLTDFVGGLVATKIGSAVRFENGQAVLFGKGHGDGSLNLGKGLLGDGDASIEIWAARTAFRKWARVFDYGIAQHTYFMMSWNMDVLRNFGVEVFKKKRLLRSERRYAPWNDNEEIYVAVTIKVSADGATAIKWNVYDSMTGTKRDHGAFNLQGDEIKLSDFLDANFYLGRSQYPADSDANATYNEVRIWKGVLSDADMARDVELGADALAAESTYVSRSALHAAYRSKERKRVFVEIPFHDGSKGFETPPCTLDRLDEAIAASVDIIWLRVDCTRDGVLHAVVSHDLAHFTNGKGTLRDFTAKEISRLKVKGVGGISDRPLATFEELLRRGKGKVFFKFSWPMRDSVFAHATINLLNRLDAWESVICEVDDSRTLFNGCKEAWRKIHSGELQIMIYPDKMSEWANVTEEYSVWSRSADLRQIGLAGIPQRIETYFGWDPGEGRRTNDEAGWSKALSDGVTIFRTRSPKELIRFLSGHGVR